jgi:hypothetical protein
MLLIDADNVSRRRDGTGVAALLEEHGALHVRRAYCTAESAVKHQAAVQAAVDPADGQPGRRQELDRHRAGGRRHRPGVLAERPDVVVIASSDSDFAPLVARLREKGCRVVGIGQEGKTGDETPDRLRRLHRAGAPQAGRAQERKPPGTGARPGAGARARPGAAPRPRSPRRARRPARSPPPPKRGARKSAAKAPAPSPRGAAAPEVAPDRRCARSCARCRNCCAARRSNCGSPPSGCARRACSAQRHRPPSCSAFPEKFELVPAKKPNQVRLAGAVTRA